jgi:diaminopimelate decarboxylase
MILTEIGGVDIRSLADQFGTPTYVYDRATIEARIGDLRGFAVIRFAQKANSNLAILDLMRRNGIVVDAISAGEIHRALKAGYDPKQIVYTADVFDRAGQSGDEAISGSTRSPDMIRQLGLGCPVAESRSVTRIHSGIIRPTPAAAIQRGIWHETPRLPPDAGSLNSAPVSRASARDGYRASRR